MYKLVYSFTFVGHYIEDFFHMLTARFMSGPVHFIGSSVENKQTQKRIRNNEMMFKLFCKLTYNHINKYSYRKT